jgi:tripartite-type tricarboxylate transporter receptor subunit TctC
MPRSPKRSFFQVFAGIALAALAISFAPARADTWPSKTIKLVAPFAAGAASDALARALADGLRAELGQTVIVENRGGAGGSLGVGAVVSAPPDGYTIVLGGIGSIVFVEGTHKLKYSALTDLRPVALVASAQSALVVRQGLGVNNLGELVARAKQQPPLTYGSPGVGSALHLAGSLFEQSTGAKMTHVPYKGLAPALTDLQAGNVDIVFANITSLPPFLQSGKVKPLAVISDKPSPQLPGVPTAAAAGVKGVELETWYGVMMPARVPDHIAARLEAAIGKAMKREEFVKAMQAQGFDTEPEPTAAKFSRVLKRDFAQWLPVIKKLDLQTQ